MGIAKSAPVMIMAGGTGGHVFPGLAVAAILRQQDIPVLWLGAHGLETKLVPQAGIPLLQISVAGLRGQGIRRLITAPLMLLRAISQALLLLRRHRPRVVLGMGGFASGPGGIAAMCLRIPLVIHEQNAVAGLTNRCLARFASRVLEAFPGSFSRIKALPVGNPVRREIAAIEPPERRFANRTGKNLRVLILGGSQGAQILNQVVPEALALLDQTIEIWHQTGERNYTLSHDTYRALDLGLDLQPRVDPFIDDMAAAYAWADIVVCRAGALTIAELAAAGLGSVLVPFPHAVDDHQTVNAQFLQQAQAALILPQNLLSAAILARLLTPLLEPARTQLLQMAQAARRLARTDAAQQVTTVCLEQAR